jgi:hypothetical protein
VLWNVVGLVDLIVAVGMGVPACTHSDFSGALVDSPARAVALAAEIRYAPADPPRGRARAGLTLARRGTSPRWRRGHARGRC